MPKSKGQADLKVELVPLSELRPHPRNYKEHPDDQIEHLMQSIKENGLYRNIVVARDGTILAGHGVVKAARKLSLTDVPVIRLDLDSDEPRALKVMAADNEVAHLAEVDDRALSELLKQVHDQDLTGLLGTGYDEMMLANLLMVTRSREEIADFDEAAEWVGMPGYVRGPERFELHVFFESNSERLSFLEKNGLTLTHMGKSAWWPPRERDDVKSVRFEQD